MTAMIIDGPKTAARAFLFAHGAGAPMDSAFMQRVAEGIAAAGDYHQATFDASRLASGVYFSRLEYDGKTQMKKMLLLK